MTPVTDDERLLHAIRRWPEDFAREFKLLRDFAKWAIANSSFAGTDLDGGDVQIEAVRMGLLVEVLYDRDKHGEVDGIEEGDGIFEYAGPLKDLSVPA